MQVAGLFNSFGPKRVHLNNSWSPRIAERCIFMVIIQMCLNKRLNISQPDSIFNVFVSSVKAILLRPLFKNITNTKISLEKFKTWTPICIQLQQTLCKSSNVEMLNYDACYYAFAALYNLSPLFRRCIIYHPSQILNIFHFVSRFIRCMHKIMYA